MIGKTLLLTVCFYLCFIYILLDQLYFLSSYRHVLWELYGLAMACYGIAVFINLFGALFIINRKIFLKDAGKKLELLEKSVAMNADTMATDFEQWR